MSTCLCDVHNARTRVVPTNPLKADPTRSKMLRRALERAFQRRFNNLRRAVFDLIATEDAFGLRKTLNEEQNNGINRQITTEENRKEVRHFITKSDSFTPFPPNSVWNQGFRLQPNTPRKLTQNQRFRFQSTPEQLKSFQSWLKTQVDLDVLQGGALNPEDAYWTKFVEEGYKKGQGRAFIDSKPAALAGSDAQSLAFYEGTKQEFLRSAFGSPVAIEKVKILSARVFSELNGVTAAMSQSLTRELIDGIARGENPHTIARRMQDNIDKIGKRRATLIARTEITRAHAEGQLDAMELLGVEKVGVAVEWSTAGDDRVCPLCQPLEGVVMSLKEARGIIPRHPQCRCAFVPANVGEDQKDQIRSKGGIDSALGKSVGQERPKFKYKEVPGRVTPTGKPVRRRVGKNRETIAQAKKRSPWVGADRRVSKARPKGILDSPIEKVTPKAPTKPKTTPKPKAPAVPKPKSVVPKPTPKVKPPAIKKPKPKKVATEKKAETVVTKSEAEKLLAVDKPLRTLDITEGTNINPAKLANLFRELEDEGKAILTEDGWKLVGKKVAKPKAVVKPKVAPKKKKVTTKPKAVSKKKAKPPKLAPEKTGIQDVFPEGEIGDKRLLDTLSKIESEQRLGSRLVPDHLEKSGIELSRLAEDVSAIERAIEDYTGVGYRKLNKALREGGALTTRQKQLQKILNKLAKEDLAEPITVYRAAGKTGEQMVSLAKKILLKGQGTIVDKGFVSTSINPGTALKFQGKASKKVLLQIRTNKGAYLEKVSQTPGEFEVLLQNNTKYKVKGVDKNVLVKGRGDNKYTVIRLEVL